jgi:hypothetical protein
VRGNKLEYPDSIFSFRQKMTIQINNRTHFSEAKVKLPFCLIFAILFGCGCYKQQNLERVTD